MAEFKAHKHSVRMSPRKGRLVAALSRGKKVGEAVAKRALAKGIEEVCFDRGGFLYHGRVAELAEGAREGGLKF